MLALFPLGFDASYSDCMHATPTICSCAGEAGEEPVRFGSVCRSKAMLGRIIYIGKAGHETESMILD